MFPVEVTLQCNASELSILPRDLQFLKLSQARLQLRGEARYPLHNHPGFVKFRKPLASESPVALATPFPISILTELMCNSHAIVSILIRLSYARSLRRTRWTNLLLRHRVPTPNSSPLAVMRQFTRMMHSFNTALPRQRYGTSRMLRPV
jgi:hypothetical protein